MISPIPPGRNRSPLPPPLHTTRAPNLRSSQTWKTHPSSYLLGKGGPPYPKSNLPPITTYSGKKVN